MAEAAAAAQTITYVDTSHAPVIYFETVPFTGSVNGVYRLTLAAGLLSGTVGGSGGGKIENTFAVVAHLRGNKEALLELRNGIDQALAAASAQSGIKPN